MSDSTAVPKSRRWFGRLASALTASLLLVGPWPVDDSSFEGSAYQRRTFDRLETSHFGGEAGSIRVGLAEVDLSPISPRPLAGFIGQIRTPFVGVDSPCLARALTVERGAETVTILTADLLMINAKVARAVVGRSGLRPDQVYFTSSHTHGGPGGWGDHPLEMLVAGAYDPAYFETLVNQLVQTVKASRSSLEPAEMGFVEVQTRDRQRNRVDPALPTHDALSALVFRPPGASPGAAPLAILVVFGAHATVSHPVPPRLGGDYPSALSEELKRQTGARSVLFASGAVGDASPSRPKARSQFQSAQALGKALAGDLMAALPSTHFERDVKVGNLRLEVDLPPVRLPFFTAKLRFSPAMTWWIADRQTHLHAIRLGPAVLVGFPGDYSGHLADSLDVLTRMNGLTVVPTSFDGDFRGYLVSSPIFFRISCYETRWMSFYGPWTGDYFNDLARRMVNRLADRPEVLTLPELSRDDLINRFALGVLILAGVLIRWRGCFVLGWPRKRGLAPAGLGQVPVPISGANRVTPGQTKGTGTSLRSGASPLCLTRSENETAPIRWRDRREVLAIAGRIGWLTVTIGVVAILGFLLTPDLFAWAKFEAVWYIRLLGLPIGLFGLRRGLTSQAALLFAIGCGLLGASWVVVLMVGRGWVIEANFRRMNQDFPETPPPSHST
jgi:neutral ceramidase